MKRTLALFTAALMSTAIAGAPALAQSSGGASTGTSGSMKSGTDMGSQSTGSKTNNTDQMKMKSDTSGNMGASGSMMSMADVTSKLQTMTEVSSVKVLKTSDMANTDHKSTDAMPPMDTTPEEQQALQTAIKGNAAISSKLEAQSVDPSQVIAANVDANNTVTVYVK